MFQKSVCGGIIQIFILFSPDRSADPSVIDVENVGSNLIIFPELDFRIFSTLDIWFFLVYLFNFINILSFSNCSM